MIDKVTVFYKGPIPSTSFPGPLPRLGQDVGEKGLFARTAPSQGKGPGKEVAYPQYKHNGQSNFLSLKHLGANKVFL